MAGDKLTGYELPNIHGQKSGFGTNVLSTDLTHGDKYADLINVRGAKFLDLNHSSVKIDDADDLKAALKEYDVSMSIAFNDNPDNDEFRKAYIVVITGLEKKDGGDEPTPTTGTVQFAKNYTDRDGKPMGTITVTKDPVVTKLGTVNFGFTIKAPEWVSGGATDNKSGAATTAEVTFQIVADGEVVYTETATGVVQTDAANYNKTFEVNQGSAGVNAAHVQGYSNVSKVELVVTKVEYSNILVKYVDENGGNMPMVTADTTWALAKAGAQFKMHVNTSATEAATWTAGGVTNPAASVTDKAFNTNVGTAQTTAHTAVTLVPDNKGYVIITITPDDDIVTNYNVVVADTALASATTDLRAGIKVSNMSHKSGFTAADAAALTLKLATVAAAGDGIPSSDKYNPNTLKVTLTGTAAQSYIYKVTVDAGNGIEGVAYIGTAGTYSEDNPKDGSYTIGNKLGTAANLTGAIPVKLTDNVLITEDMVTIEVIENKVLFTTADWDSNDYTITLHSIQDLDKTTAETAANYNGTFAGGAAIQTAKLVDSKTVVLYLDKAPEVDDGVALTVNVESATKRGTQNNKSVVANVITLKADGKCDVALT